MFAGYKFAVVQPDQALAEKIEANGGQITTWDARLDRETTPHMIVVSDTSDYEYYDEMSKLMVPTVFTSWIDDCLEKQQVVPTRPYNPDRRLFMSGVNLCCFGFSDGDKDAIKAGVRSSGGDFSEELTKLTTHVLARDLNHSEVELAMNAQLDLEIISPEWFDDCMKLQRRVDERHYRLLHKDAQSEQRDLTATFYDTSDDEEAVPKRAIEESIRLKLGTSLFAKRKFFFADDLEVSEQMMVHLDFLVRSNGGEKVSSLEESNVYLGKWRAGDQYIEACTRKLVVGSLNWFYWMCIQQQWESPTKYLFHYPGVPGGLPDFKGMVICITNYMGDARQYLKTLIQSLGATYTGTLTNNENTHVVAAYSGGKKYEAAKNWGIHVVNHLWLEESYALWQKQDESIPRYSHLPKRLDLSTLIGCTPLIPSVLRRFHSRSSEAERHLPARAARDNAQRRVHHSVMKENKFLKGMPVAYEQAVVVESKKRAADPVPESSPPSQRPKPELPHVITPPKEEHEPEDSTKSLNKDTTKSKAQKPTKNNGPLRVIITGVDKPPSKQKAAKVGIQIVDKPPASILVAPRILRTPKFLCGLGYVDKVVLPSWVMRSVEKGVQDTAAYELDDQDLKSTLKRMHELKTRNRKLFTGMHFNLSPKVKGGIKVATDIIRAHGGQIKRNGILIGGDDEGGKTLDSVINAILAMDNSKLDT